MFLFLDSFCSQIIWALSTVHVNFTISSAGHIHFGLCCVTGHCRRVSCLDCHIFPFLGITKFNIIIDLRNSEFICWNCVLTLSSHNLCLKVLFLPAVLQVSFIFYLLLFELVLMITHVNM